MDSKLTEIFKDEKLCRKIQKRLPFLFQLAEVESSRAGKIGMEVGIVRERIIVSLLIYKFGSKNVETEIPTTEAEVDVRLFSEPISIKTITGAAFGGVKLIWTVDPKKAKEFALRYQPSCDILLVQINWNQKGGVYHLPLKNQEKIFDEIGRSAYIKLPVPGTNPRGVEITSQALNLLIKQPGGGKIEIEWKKSEIDFNPYARWVEHWEKD